MEMYFLVLGLWGNGAVVMPEKYPKEQCEEAGKHAFIRYRCIPAPKLDVTNRLDCNAGQCFIVPHIPPAR